ncbi:MAG: hypothetical protein HKN41_02680 [Ilumatobacter sp.]|nr:hypothetical protein [Ilumatobacter sp.]
MTVELVIGALVVLVVVVVVVVVTSGVVSAGRVVVGAVDAMVGATVDAESSGDDPLVEEGGAAEVDETTVVSA